MIIYFIIYDNVWVSYIYSVSEVQYMLEKTSLTLISFLRRIDDTTLNEKVQIEYDMYENLFKINICL